MKKIYFLLVALVVSVTMFADDATFFFSGKGPDGENCALTRVVVENLTKGWTETLTGPQFSLVMKEQGQGFESVYTGDGALTMAGANPCYGVTKLNLSLEQSGNVNISLYDITGRLVCSKSDLMAEGNYSLNVSMPTPQMYYLKVETAQGSFNAKLLNYGICFTGGISVSNNGAKRFAAKANSNIVYGVGDNMKFTGYTTYEDQEYSDVQTRTVTRGMTEIVTFSFALPQKPAAQDTASLYLGIIGFNDELVTYPLSKVTKTKASGFKSFIDGLMKDDGTLLYHAEWNALESMQQFVAPKDLANATLITFTDGLDLGSWRMNDVFKPYKNNNKFLDSLNYRTKHDKVADLDLSAYCIGVKGEDIADEDMELFYKNLSYLSSVEDNALEVKNMDDVNRKFDSIARNLNKVNTLSNLRIKTVSDEEGMFKCWTFDLDTTIQKWAVGTPDLPESKQYISAVYHVSDDNISYLTDITTVGMSCVVPDTLWGDSEYKSTFEFKDVRDALNNPIMSFPMITEYKRRSETSPWNKNSEFKRGSDTDAIPQNSSAVIMLVLDCSSSLGDKGLQDIKNAAKNFIDIITADLKDDDTPTQEDNTKYCWEVTYKYDGASQTSYLWATESDVKVLQNNYGAANFSYKKSSASDEHSCEALNSPSEEIQYYIKHSWGSGADADWSWERMTKSGNEYVYEGLWGGIGANINTTASDKGAIWYSASDISGSSALAIGDEVRFTYNPNYSSLSVTKIGGSQGAKVRFRKTYDDESMIALGIADESEVLEYYEFGTGSGTSAYYDIPAGTLYPVVYWLGDDDNEEGWYDWTNLPYYVFEAGKKYTYVLDTESVSITVDGSFNSPKRVQVKATKYIEKAPFPSKH